MDKVAVVVPVLSQFKMAVDVLANIKTEYFWQPYIIPNYDLKMGVAQSWNVGTHKAIEDGFDYILIINDDILMMDFAIDGLVEVFESNPKVGLVSGSDCRNTLKNPKDVFDMDGRADKFLIDGPDFACFMIRPETFLEVGDFDERFFPAYFEDDDYSYRMVKNKNWDIRRANHVLFYHYGSQTQNAGGKKVVPSEIFVQNRMHYINKWGGTPGHEKVDEPLC